MPSKRKRKSSTPPQYLGQPVLVVLKDGSYYVGRLDHMDRNEIALSGLRAENKLQTSHLRDSDKAEISGLLSSLFGGRANVEGAGAGAGAGAGIGAERGAGNTGFFGLFGQMMPHIQLGMKMVRTIMPIMGLFK